MDNFNLRLQKDNNDKSNSYMTQAQNIWSMLDEMAQSSPESYKKFIEKTIREGKELMKPPEPNMCVLTKIADSKFYINFFAWNKVKAPENDEAPIPVFGQPIEKLEKCLMINISFNPDVLSKYGKEAKNEEEREALIDLAFQYIENQNKVKINRGEVKVLEDRIHFGELKDCISNLTGKKSSDKKSEEDELVEQAMQSMELDEQPNTTLINKLLNLNPTQESSSPKIATPKVKTSDEPKKSKPLIEELSKEEAVVPKFELAVVEKSDTTMLEFKISLDKVTSMSECELTIEDDFIKLVANKKFYKPLDIPLAKLKENLIIDSDSISAKFIKKQSILKITIKVLKK